MLGQAWWFEEQRRSEWTRLHESKVERQAEQDSNHGVASFLLWEALEGLLRGAPPSGLYHRITPDAAGNDSGMSRGGRQSSEETVSASGREKMVACTGGTRRRWGGVTGCC